MKEAGLDRDVASNFSAFRPLPLFVGGSEVDVVRIWTRRCASSAAAHAALWTHSGETDSPSTRCRLAGVRPDNAAVTQDGSPFGALPPCSLCVPLPFPADTLFDSLRRIGGGATQTKSYTPAALRDRILTRFSSTPMTVSGIDYRLERVPSTLAEVVGELSPY